LAEAGPGRFADTGSRRRLPRIATLTALSLLFVVGCGEGGVAEDATVSVYATTPLCAGAERALARAGNRAGDLGVRLVCVAGGRVARWQTAAIAAGARRAAEDTSTVTYLGVAEPAASRFSRPILEEAGIADIVATSGSAAMSRVLIALRRAADSGDGLREAVLDELR
jgi:hypothetical protein